MTRLYALNEATPEGSFSSLKELTQEGFANAVRACRNAPFEIERQGGTDNELHILFSHPILAYANGARLMQDEWLEIGLPDEACVYQVRLVTTDETAPEYPERGTMRVPVTFEEAGHIFERWVRYWRAADRDEDAVNKANYAAY